MNRDEIQQLLVFASSFDRRRIEEADVLAWHDLLGDLDYPDAYEAVARHYAKSEKRLYPADVRQGVVALRSRRIGRAPDEAPDVDPDDVAAYIEAIAARRAALGDGREPATAPALPAAPSSPPEEITARHGRDETWHNALLVACPWCKAAPGERCTSIGGRELRGAPYHPSRLDRARQSGKEQSA